MAINVEFLKNPIDPDSQVSFPYYYDGDNKETAKLKIMFIGNSITFHERIDAIGWHKNCGMAASDLDHDYVHVVYHKLKEKYGKVAMCVFNGATWERDYLNQDKLDLIIKTAKDFAPDIIIIRIGENFNKPMLKDGIDPFPAFDGLLKGCLGVSKNISISSMFWAHPILDEAITKAANINKCNYFLLSDLGADRKYLAYEQYNNSAGYCGHPGDYGMEVIAERVLNEISKLGF